MKRLFRTQPEGAVRRLRGKRHLRAMSPRTRAISVLAIFAVIGGGTVAVTSLNTASNAAFANVTNLNYTGNDQNDSNPAVLNSFDVYQINGVAPVLATDAQKAGIVETPVIKKAVVKYALAAGGTITYRSTFKRADNTDDSYRVAILIPKNSTAKLTTGDGWNCFPTDPSVFVQDPNYQFGATCWKTIVFPTGSTAQSILTLDLTVTMDAGLPDFHPIQAYPWRMACAPSNAAACLFCLDVISNPTTPVPPTPINPALTTVKTLTKVNGVTAVAGQTVKPNDILTYTLTTTNTGGAMTAAQTLTDTVPVGTTYKGQSSPPETWANCVAPVGSGLGSAAGTACTHDVTLGASPASVVLTFTVVVDAVIPTSLTQIKNAATGPGCTPTVTSCSPPPNPLPPIVVTPGLTTVKTLAKVNGIQATPGQQVKPSDILTYTLTTTNTGGAMTAAQTLTDTVPVGATYKGQSSPPETWANCVAPVGSGLGSAAGTACTHDVTLGASPASVVLTFTVVVDAVIPPSIREIKNAATGPGCTPTVTSCSPPPNPLPPLVPGFSLKKSVTTANAGFAKPGEIVKFTVQIKNTGETAYSGGATDAAWFDDDLSAVLDDAVYNNDAAFVSSPANGAGAFTIEPTHLKWRGALALAGTVTVTYSVTVLTRDAATAKYAAGSNQWLDNKVTSNPESNCVVTSASGKPDVPADCKTRTPVKSFITSKVANATTLKAGDKLTYTVTVKNDGQMAYSKELPARFTDNLTAVLTNAIYNNDASSGATYAAPVLSWAGVLAVGETVVVTYTVTAKATQTGNHLLVNNVTTPSEGGCDAAALGILNLVGTRPEGCQVTTKLTDLPLPVVSA